MKYWWVSQNKTYKEELEGGYLWSPKTQKDGKQNNSYNNMPKVSPGDIVFSFKSTRIQAMSIAKSSGYSFDIPKELPNDEWKNDGWKVDVEYHALKKLIRPKNHIEQLGPHLPKKYSPLKSNGDGNESYLFELPKELAEEVIALVGSEATGIIDSSADILDKLDSDKKQNEIVENLTISTTEKQQLITSRRGQGVFRLRLEAIEPCCRITHVDQKRHLIASHIKPWSKSDNIERLDGNNGLLLAPHIDHLFDKGYISFENNGDLIISEHASKDLLVSWSIELGNYGSLNKKQKFYMTYHRNEVFEKFLKS